MDTRQRVASVGFGLAVLLATVLQTEGMPIWVGAAGLAVIVFMLVYGGRKLLAGFYRSLGRSALAGLIAGVVVLGPLFRGAMRIVALSEPGRVLEFTIGGTLFIIIFIGVIAGAATGIGLRFMTSGIGWGRLPTSLLAGVIILGALMLSPDIRGELFEFGAGPLMNIPLFGAAGVLYGWFFQVTFDRLGMRRASTKGRLETPAVATATIDGG